VTIGVSSNFNVEMLKPSINILFDACDWMIVFYFYFYFYFYFIFFVSCSTEVTFPAGSHSARNAKDAYHCKTSLHAIEHLLDLA